ncbi:hypothetical protein TSUD_382900 [Trifolium subterraneum]|uniref:Uncharacterized protein n=1 Tax=Trifolium subterraneum TaxID=3900 RepID=A0A2Z6P7Y8_TRISU|nr:hypothetical protein TSUD_382900 [Trifolium subterraneum]
MHIIDKDTQLDSNTIHRVATLFEDHSDLLDGFITFLPDATTAASAHAAAQNSVFCDRRSAMPTVRQAHVEKVNSWVC